MWLELAHFADRCWRASGPESDNDTLAAGSIFICKFFPMLQKLTVVLTVTNGLRCVGARRPLGAAAGVDGERFSLTVHLGPDATDGQAADVGRTFAREVAEEGITTHQTDLDLRLPIDPPPPKNNNTTDYSDAGFHFGRSDTTDSPTADDVADSAALWFRTAKSPTAQRVDLLQPTWAGSHRSRQLTVTLWPEATAADALALQASEHGLADAWWEVSIAGDEMYRPHDYSLLLQAAATDRFRARVVASAQHRRWSVGGRQGLHEGPSIEE
jgi:hypothetical protein